MAMYNHLKKKLDLTFDQCSVQDIEKSIHGKLFFYHVTGGSQNVKNLKECINNLAINTAELSSNFWPNEFFTNNKKLLQTRVPFSCVICYPDLVDDQTIINLEEILTYLGSNDNFDTCVIYQGLSDVKTMKYVKWCRGIYFITDKPSNFTTSNKRINYNVCASYRNSIRRSSSVMDLKDFSKKEIPIMDYLWKKTLSEEYEDDLTKDIAATLKDIEIKSTQLEQEEKSINLHPVVKHTIPIRHESVIIQDLEVPKPIRQKVASNWFETMTGFGKPKNTVCTKIHKFDSDLISFTLDKNKSISLMNLTPYYNNTLFDQEITEVINVPIVPVMKPSPVKATQVKPSPVKATQAKPSPVKVTPEKPAVNFISFLSDLKNKVTKKNNKPNPIARGKKMNRSITRSKKNKRVKEVPPPPKEVPPPPKKLSNDEIDELIKITYTDQTHDLEKFTNSEILLMIEDRDTSGNKKDGPDLDNLNYVQKVETMDLEKSDCSELELMNFTTGDNSAENAELEYNEYVASVIDKNNKLKKKNSSNHNFKNAMKKLRENVKLTFDDYNNDYD
ncbi:hypothetical protein [Salmon gill poxvirus]|nr:hypothetical protein [Salmon gill poxvirus]